MPVDEIPAGARRLRLRLAPDVDAPARARDALRALALGAHEDDLLLLASELVTNAVVHAGLEAGEVIELDADRAPDGAWRVAVRDHGHGFEPGGPAVGLGLHMMAEATPDWGFSRDDGTCVWFELR